MQIAQVVPKIRTRGEGIFDYSIPPQLLPEIKIGLLVLVPFRGRNIEGIIIDIKRSSQIQNLKPITSIIDPIPVVDTIHIDLARWMSDYYLTDFSKCLFENIVPPAKRTIKKLSEAETKKVYIKSFLIKPSRQYLVIADFSSRLKFYAKIIKKNIVQDKQVVILVPDLDLVQYFNEFLKEKLTVLHAGLTKTERWINWDLIRQNQVKIIIGSNSALFAPAHNLGLIIIDQEENETYKSDQSPRYNALKVAQKLAQISRADLVIGSSTPSYTTYHEARRKKNLYKEKNQTNPDISVINMNFERSILSQPLQDQLSNIIVQNQKAILVLNRRGEGSRSICSDCGWIYNCPMCKLPLVPNIQEMTCYNCEKNFPLIPSCPNCKSINLKITGLTTVKLEKMILNMWPQAKTIRIEKDHTVDLNQNWQIAIVTSFALKYVFHDISLITIMDADQGLNFPGFRTQEKSFQTFYKFLKIGKLGIIQTHLPDNVLIRDLASTNYEKAYQQEMTNRLKFRFPPFVNLIKLIYRNTKEEICQKESAEIATKLKSIISANNIRVEILGPSPSFVSQKNRYFFYQIILKISERSKMIDDLLKVLPKGWIVDVDPYDII